ncbi:receptor-type tyrosine-protein phosphatase N2 isoform X2 [Sardina pilchardus]|uniref:receptor-type tyrosine-protein phosphatase N2 isoform X2 n=1 Tax=Sardina pilchardus TaxID=27697 RepID=UPI002E0F1AD3
MDSRCFILAVLLAFHAFAAIAADRKFGCLFEDGVCESYEVCANDGVFGRCQAFPVTEAYSYDVSPSALRQLRSTLQKLAHRGYTWQDDTTQQVITKELAKLPKIPLRHLEASFADFPGTSRAKAPPPDANRKLKMEEAELSKSLQKHLQDLGFLPPTSSQSRSQSQSQSQSQSLSQSPEGSLRQLSGDRYHLIEYVQPNTQGKGKTTATFFSYRAPKKTQGQGAAVDGVGVAPAPVTPPAGPDQERAKALLRELQQYLAGDGPVRRPGSPPVSTSVSASARPLGRLDYFSMLRPLAAERLKAAEAKAGRFGGRLTSQKVLEAPKPPLPRIDRLFFQSAPKPPAPPKEPLSLVDERFIQSVVTQLGRKSVNVEAMSPKDLDQLSDIIAEALQVVDGVGPQVSRQRGREVTADEGAADEDEDEDESEGESEVKRDPELDPELRAAQPGALKEETAPQAQQTKVANSNSDDKDGGFIKQLLEYLDQTTDPGAFSPNTPPDVPVLGEPANLRAPLAPGRVSVENVQSKTTQTQLDVPQKKEKKEDEEEEDEEAAEEEEALAADPLDSLDLLGEADVEQWMRGAAAPDMGLLSEPQKKDMGLLSEPQKKDMGLLSEPQKKDMGLLSEPQKKDMGLLSEPQKKDMGSLRAEEEREAQQRRLRVEELTVGVATYTSPEKDADFGYVITEDSLSTDQGLNLMELLAGKAKLRVTDFLQLSVLGPAVTFRVRPNARNVSTAELARVAVAQKDQLEKETGLHILEAGMSDRSKLNQIPIVKHSHVESSNFLVLTVVSMVFIVMVLGVSGALYCLRHHSHLKLKEKLASLGTDTSADATAAYQDLCRQRMAGQTSERAERGERPEPLAHTSHTSRINSVSSQFSDGPMPSPSARSSTSSWSEEPAHSNMDISTGHMILSYMEDHLKNKNRLEKEWEALCSYQAEPGASAVGQETQNIQRNRPNGVLVYDHSRVTLKPENNHNNSDYINASPIMDHDPRNPAYISAQGPLPSTVADFWQMVWESGCVVVVMLTPLSENGNKQCQQYWPDEGSTLYHIYEVNLVSEHIWCEDFLVRSFYLKNVQTNETRTVSQFHFLSWMDLSVPESARTLLDFRRKVNKCYRGRSCPVIIHCSDGAGRSGTYILIDMVLNKMAKGAKEIDIAATLEHLRDQRPSMVQTKQFEFALTAVAEEVNAILKALPQ